MLLQRDLLHIGAAIRTPYWHLKYVQKNVFKEWYMTCQKKMKKIVINVENELYNVSSTKSYSVNKS